MAVTPEAPRIPHFPHLPHFPTPGEIAGEFKHHWRRYTLAAVALAGAGLAYQMFTGADRGPSAAPVDNNAPFSDTFKPPSGPSVDQQPAVVINPNPPVDSRPSSPPPPVEVPKVSPVEEAIQIGKIELKEPKEWEKYFEYVSEDQLRTLYANARKINPSAYIFPQIDLIDPQNLNDITITNETKITPKSGTAFWAVVLNGLSKGLNFRANYEGETWPSSIATHSVEISGKEGDRNHVLVLPQVPSQPNTLLGEFIPRNKPGIKTSLGKPLDYVRTSDKISEDYLPFSAQAVYYIRKQNADGTSSFTDAKFENAVKTETNKFALLSPSK